MDKYVTGAAIRRLREEKHMTQLELADRLGVSDKAVSKWETGRAYPDIMLLEPLAGALGISVAELLSGEDVVNTNRSFNMTRVKFYVCPVCGNILTATGEAVVSCCGISLPPLEAEAPDPEHSPVLEISEDEYFVSIPHEMSREHFISFIAGIRDDSVELVKLYPEGNAQCRLKRSRLRAVCCLCNRHGLFRLPVRPSRRGI